jgi:hypothetical protein
MAFFFVRHKSISVEQNPMSPAVHQEVQVMIDEQTLNFSKEDIVFVEDLMPKIRIKSTKEILTLSIDDSLNVLGDDFYGGTIFQDGGIEFKPNFVLLPGNHQITIVFNNQERVSWKFTLGYHEEFSQSLDGNPIWIIPELSSPAWFLVKDEKLRIIPQSNIQHSSLAFVYTLGNSFEIDFELVPLGKKVSSVPYIINSVRNEFVLGSNSDNRNVLFYSDTDGQEQIEGRPFTFEEGVRYQVRLKRKDSVVSLFVRPLGRYETTNPGLLTDEFSEVIVHSDLDKDSYTSSPYHFGISIWQSSDGILVDDIYITNI